MTFLRLLTGAAALTASITLFGCTAAPAPAPSSEAAQPSEAQEEAALTDPVTAGISDLPEGSLPEPATGWPSDSVGALHFSPHPSWTFLGEDTATPNWISKGWSTGTQTAVEDDPSSGTITSYAQEAGFYQQTGGAIEPILEANSGWEVAERIAIPGAATAVLFGTPAYTPDTAGSTLTYGQGYIAMLTADGTYYSARISLTAEDPGLTQIRQIVAGFSIS